MSPFISYAININWAYGCFFHSSKVRYPLKFSDRWRIGNKFLCAYTPTNYHLYAKYLVIRMQQIILPLGG